MTPLQRYLILILLAFGITAAPRAQAAWTFFPESDNQRYRTFGLFFDQQSTAVNYGAARFWGALGGNTALVGDPDSDAHPQLVVTATANAALHYNESFRIWTDTIDARVGFSYQMELNPQLRFSVGFIHDSGHAVDGMATQDLAELYEPTLGQESLPIRFIYDLDRQFRFGVTLKPFLRAFPEMERFAAEEFAEWFPWSASDDRKTANPYIALGLDHRGPKGQLKHTLNAQIGVYWGNHFDRGFRQTIRTVVGYYTGADPRLKYFEFRAATLSYAYLGLMFDI
jgi:hypothetical protein